MASADSCRMRGIEDVGMVELVFVGGMLWMGGDSLLVPVWRSVRDGFTGKGELDVWVVRAGTCRHEISMEAEWATSVVNVM